jgi:amidase
VTDDITSLSAVEMAARIRRKELSAREVLESHLTRIDRVNPTVNAIVTLAPERARAWANAADEQQARGGVLGPLHGLPVAHKDLVDTADIRTTRGSLYYKDFIPTADALIVQRLRAAGAITIGKTNTPEFGAGSHTFNPIFGATRNPYDLSRTAGGSSGGAACALACNLVPIADGSDTGGSLRNPAAWNNVVGFRPSPGRVPGDDGGWSPLSTPCSCPRSPAFTPPIQSRSPMIPPSFARRLPRALRLRRSRGS